MATATMALPTVAQFPCVTEKKGGGESDIKVAFPYLSFSISFPSISLIIDDTIACNKVGNN